METATESSFDKNLWFITESCLSSYAIKRICLALNQQNLSDLPTQIIEYLEANPKEKGHLLQLAHIFSKLPADVAHEKKIRLHQHSNFSVIRPKLVWGISIAAVLGILFVLYLLSLTQSAENQEFVSEKPFIKHDSPATTHKTTPTPQAVIAAADYTPNIYFETYLEERIGVKGETSSVKPKLTVDAIEGQLLTKGVYQTGKAIQINISSDNKPVTFELWNNINHPFHSEPSKKSPIVILQRKAQSKSPFMLPDYLPPGVYYFKTYIPDEPKSVNYGKFYLK